jgi:hypothetical protein
MELGSSSRPLDFSHWEAECAALISETDPIRLAERVSALETAIFNRLQELPKEDTSDGELSAIRSVINVLRTIREEKLCFLKLRKEA